MAESRIMKLNAIINATPEDFREILEYNFKIYDITAYQLALIKYYQAKHTTSEVYNIIDEILYDIAMEHAKNMRLLSKFTIAILELGLKLDLSKDILHILIE